MTGPNILVKTITIIDSFFDKISKGSMVISGFLLVCITIIIFIGVINREFIGFKWLFVEEYSMLALIPISYIAMGYTLRSNQHLKLDLLVRSVPNRIKEIFGIFAALFSLVCLVYMTIFSTDWLIYTLENNVTSSGVLRTPLWMISAFMSIGIALFTIDMLLLVIHRVIKVIYRKSTLQFEDNEEEIII